MTHANPTFFARIPLAIRALMRILFDSEFAAAVQRLAVGRTMPDAPVATAVAQPVMKTTGPESAMQLLGLLQQQGRFIDFLEEDIAAYADAEIGAATRLVHAGCRKTVHEYLSIVPIRDEAEGARITLGAGFDPAAVRLTGNVVGNPPFTGTVAHRGWRAGDVRLPRLAPEHDVTILAPAEVEL